MTIARHERAIIGEKPHCPQCDGVELRRQGRVGVLQRVVLPRLGLFPWECGLCRKIYLLRQRSTDYRQHSTEAGVTPIRMERAPEPGIGQLALETILQKKRAR